MKYDKSFPKRGLNLLFVDYAVPMYDKYAGSRTNYMYLDLLVKMGLKVKFLPADFKILEPYSSELESMGVEMLHGEHFGVNWEKWFESNGSNLDFVFFNKPEPTIKFLESIRKYSDASIIYQCHDLHYLRLRRKAEIENDENSKLDADRFEKYEDLIFSVSDVILTFSSVEEEIIHSKFPDKSVFTVPLYFYEHVRESQIPFKDREGLLFIGGCAHAPNRDALHWLCGEVLPLVRKEIPDILLNVVGPNPPKDVQALQSPYVKILGGVSDSELNSLYQSSRISVIPLRFGAGVKGKTIEALYHGVPMVSTSIGIEGIKEIDSLVTAKDRPADFAAEIVSLYRDGVRWAELAVQGKDFVAQHLTLGQAANQFENILEIATEEKEKRTVQDEPPRLISFYLPQYHPIPENDEWWGKGFTEWRNVAKAEPLFPGHYQPHLPADLGFYDLRLEAARIAQADMARDYGVHGFCFYHYWFNGKRLLEKPAEDMLASGKPDFPFCLCWANENWTRRWDGEDQFVLMQQNYSDEDDREHIRDLFRFFKDDRYIRVDGKPMFLVYRTENMPDPGRTAEIWREEARRAGMGELYLVRVESVGKCDPADIGFDAALEFAPDWWNKGPQIKDYQPAGAESPDEIERISLVHKTNYIHSYDVLIEKMLAKEVPDYTWMRCVTPSWDNTARRKEGAHVFLNSSPEKYRYWLERVIAQTKSRLSGDEKIVFVNAWNEWAEGNHLEPDQLYGHAYLEATRNALFSPSGPELTHEPGKNIQIPEAAGGSAETGSTLSFTVNKLRKSISDLENKVHSLEMQLSEKSSELQCILMSRCWRLTWPVRWIFLKLGLTRQ